MDIDITSIISHESETCNGIPISKFRLIAERYPCVSGIWVDPKVPGACVNPQGRIFLNPSIPIETVARFPLDGNEVDEVAAAWLAFLHEVGHLKFKHLKNDATCEESASAEARRKQWTAEEYAFVKEIVVKNQTEASAWAISEYEKLKQEGELA